MQNPENYLNDVQAAKLLGLKPQTLRNWRALSKGPNYRKFGRAVRYKVSDLEEFGENNKVRHDA